MHLHCGPQGDPAGLVDESDVGRSASRSSGSRRARQGTESKKAVDSSPPQVPWLRLTGSHIQGSRALRKTREHK